MTPSQREKRTLELVRQVRDTIYDSSIDRHERAEKLWKLAYAVRRVAFLAVGDKPPLRVLDENVPAGKAMIESALSQFDDRDLIATVLDAPYSGTDLSKIPNCSGP